MKAHRHQSIWCEYMMALQMCPSVWQHFRFRRHNISTQLTMYLLNHCWRWKKQYTHDAILCILPRALSNIVKRYVSSSVDFCALAVLLLCHSPMSIYNSKVWVSVRFVCAWICCMNGWMCRMAQVPNTNFLSVSSVHEIFSLSFAFYEWNSQRMRGLPNHHSIIGKCELSCGQHSESTQFELPILSKLQWMKQKNQQ